MNCEHIDDLFSARLDGGLSDQDCEAFDAHIADCARCEGDWSEYRSAVAALRGAGRRETSPELHAATLAAVANSSAMATSEGRRSPRVVPLLAAAVAGAAAASWFAWFAFDLGARPFDVAVDEGVVTLAPGDTRSSGGVILSRSVTGELSVRAEPRAAKVVEVPVDRIVEVPVDRIVEVPVDRVVEVPVERGPLLTIDLTGMAAALHATGEHIGQGMLALAARRVERAGGDLAEAHSVDSPPAVARAPATTLSSEFGGATLRVRRTDGQMTIETSGTLEELVPTLLAQLSTPDTELQGLIERQLAAIHEQAAADPAIRDGLTAMPHQLPEPEIDERSLFGGPGEPVASVTPAAAWAIWWQENGDLITGSASL